MLSVSAGIDLVSSQRAPASVGGRLAAVESCYELLAPTFDRISWLQQFSEKRGGFVTRTCGEAHREKSPVFCDASRSDFQTVEQAILNSKQMFSFDLLLFVWTFLSECFLGRLCCLSTLSPESMPLPPLVESRGHILNPDPSLPSFPFVLLLYLWLYCQPFVLESAAFPVGWVLDMCVCWEEIVHNTGIFKILSFSVLSLLCFTPENTVCFCNNISHQRFPIRGRVPSLTVTAAAVARGVSGKIV